MSFEASARCSSGLTPAPIIARAAAKETGGTSCRARTALSVSTRSGAVSTSVPSRSKTIVGAAMRQALTRAKSQSKALRHRTRPSCRRRPGPLLAGARILWRRSHECRNLQARSRRRCPRFRPAGNAARARHRLDRQAVRRNAGRARARRPRRHRGADLGGDPRAGRAVRHQAHDAGRDARARSDHRRRGRDRARPRLDQGRRRGAAARKDRGGGFGPDGGDRRQLEMGRGARTLSLADRGRAVRPRRDRSARSRPRSPQPAIPGR